ncbi:MAG: FKBP-type peptidyl-prolyl cis-trans isomerase [Chitinispirillales bacterium]|nr:FKBP-type peptidyl-prolyl cis-trans isomerase [Chitinispirillales bacterium]
MTRAKVLMIAAVLCLAAGSGWADVGDSAKLNDETDSLSYVIGSDVGDQLEKIPVEIRLEAFMSGVTHAIKNQQPLIGDTAADSIRIDFIQKMQRSQIEEQQKSQNENLLESETFLAQNKLKKGVVTTGSGLQYKVVKKGKGSYPTQSDIAQVQYKAALSDGTLIEATAPGSPAALSIDNIIPGLAEGLMLMNKGAKFILYIPPNLAYAEQGFPPVIPPNSVLVFEIELVEF